MDRRGRVGAIVGPLCVVLMSVLGPSVAVATPEPQTPARSSAPSPEPSPAPRPPTTVSDFFPEDTNLSDCLGLLERPGCGSDSRGGWAQNVVFAVLAVGLGVVFWRISVGVRRNRADQ